MAEVDRVLGLKHSRLSRAPVIKEERNYFREIKYSLAIEVLRDVKEWRVLESVLGKGKSWDADPEN